MSMIDVLTRVDAICKKYERYDADKHRNDAADPFSRLYADMDAVIDEAIEKSERAARETNRAAAVTLNAGVRRTKVQLAEDVVKLQKLVGKKMKGVSREEMALRPDLVSALQQRIQSIPDGGGAADQNGAGNARPGLKFDSSAETLDEGYFQTSEESEAFRKEYEMRRIKQDEGLDFISEGLDTLKNLAEDMGEELDRQVPLMDEIDRKVDKANTELRKTNVRLKETVNQFRSTTNFTVDIILICIILGIGAYLYNVLAK
ncbi:syntaxin-71-like [Hordeum vulgare subsp. vulgare]|uniref:t-SNARE coiled-coil homology domain-containing protein n=1 Tax=Hordeum vulgare subsp. vulgare TaxID=112509 RepID=A0A8I6YCK3_HORVV|nr:syntaxin-71-like [Hordeum vulgare subsp. vulgare]